MEKLCSPGRCENSYDRGDRVSVSRAEVIRVVPTLASTFVRFRQRTPMMLRELPGGCPGLPLGRWVTYLGLVQSDVQLRRVLLHDPEIHFSGGVAISVNLWKSSETSYFVHGRHRTCLLNTDLAQKGSQIRTLTWVTYLELVISRKEYPPELSVLGRLEPDIPSLDFEGSFLNRVTTFVVDKPLNTSVSFSQELDEWLQNTSKCGQLTFPPALLTLPSKWVMLLWHQTLYYSYLTALFSSQYLGKSAAGGYLQQDNSKVISIQPYQT